VPLIAVTASVQVRVGRSSVLHTKFKPKRRGGTEVTTTIGADIDRRLVAAMLMMSAADLVEPVFRVKLVSMIAALQASAQKDLDTEPPF